MLPEFELSHKSHVNTALGKMVVVNIFAKNMELRDWLYSVQSNQSNFLNVIVQVQ